MAYSVDYSPLERAGAAKGSVLFQGLSGIGDQIRETKAGNRERAELEGHQDLAREAMAGSKEAAAELAIVNPEMNQQVMTKLGADTEQKQKGMAYDFYRAKEMLDSGDPEGAISWLDQRISAVEGRGGDTSHTRAMRDLIASNPEQGSKTLSSAILRMMNPEEYAKRLGGSGTGEAAKVGAQEILEDGTIIQSTPQGPVVFNPLGEKVTGQAAADAITIARAEKVSNLREAAGQKKRATLDAEMDLKGAVEANVISAKDAAKISTKAFERLENINTNIRNMDEGIQLLEDGAETGVVLKMLPSVRKNAIKLNNLQGRLGLDVLHSTTFGALSAAELKFALSTALPDKLGPEDLRDWMIERKNAQEKLSDYIEASAIFLGTPGNTVKDWMVLQREKRLERQETSGGGYTEGQTATGADGTKLVYTNGEWRPM